MTDLHIDDKYRKNPLSLQPGGHTVTVTFQNGKRYIYDKVKRPQFYVQNISQKVTQHGPMVAILVDGVLVWEASRGVEPWDF